MHGNHATAPDHACWHCQWWGGVSPEGRHGLCDRPRTCRVTALPERGCAYFSREPGADDVPEWASIEVLPGPMVWAPNVVPTIAGTPKWAP
jgi:hypothetical protein